jgi:hypothetical protein
MNTYCAVPLESGRWAVEWSVDGIVHGLTFGTFDLKVEALFHAYELARMEWREASRAAG